MKFVFDEVANVKISEKVDQLQQLRKFMLCMEATINTTFPKLRVHLTEE